MKVLGKKPDHLIRILDRASNVEATSLDSVRGLSHSPLK